jgi:hypothetical protein
MSNTLLELEKLIADPATREAILRGYNGPYSLGVARCPEGPDGFGFLLRLPGKVPPGLPHEIRTSGLRIPVRVAAGFVLPKTLAAAWSS